MKELQITKRSISTIKKDLPKAILTAVEEGDISPVEAWVYIHQVKAAIEIIMNDSSLRDKVREITDIGAAEIQDFTIRKTTGGAILDYEADHRYVELKYLLDERKKLLDTAFKAKSEIYDSQGVQIPKVPVKSYRKDSITVTINKSK